MTIGRVRIASQLGTEYDGAIVRQAGDLPIDLIAVGRGAALQMPPGVDILFAYPFLKAGEPAGPKPAAWPSGLRWVQLISSGADLFPAWLFDGPIVTNASGALAAPIAEFALAHIFAAAKRLPELWIHEVSDWRLRRHTMVEGATLGIFGFGAIGQQLARRALALGMKVHAVRRSAAPLPAGVARATDLAELMAISDHLVLAAPGNAETRHIVSAALLACAKPGLHLINVARGSLVDQEALIAALDSGQIALASLDVAEPEPLPAGHPLYSHPRVRLTAHTSAIVDDFHDRIAALMIDNLRRYLATAPLFNVMAGGGVR